MAKKTSSGAAVPRFTIEKPVSSGGSIGKLAIPRIDIDDLGATITKLIEKAEAGGVEAKSCRGTITLY